MGVLSWLIGGFIIGLLARMVVPGNRGLGCIGTIGLGMIGSLVGGTVLNALTGDGFDLGGSGFFGSLFGAVLVLVAARIFRDNGTSAP